MKEVQGRDDDVLGSPSEQTSPATAGPQEIDQTGLEQEVSEVIGQTVQEKAPAERIAQPAQAPTPHPAIGQTAAETARPEAIDRTAEVLTPQVPEQKVTSRDTAGPESPFVLMTPEEQSEVIASTAPQPVGSPSPEQAQVHIAPNLLDLTTGRVETAAEKKEAREKRDLDQVIHRMLIVGLAVSTVLMLIGIALEIIRRTDLPTVEPDFSQVFARVVALRPSGFLALGLLVLLATPVLRVVGSIIAFAYERDWRFAGITFVVLMVVISSILLGKG
jgi:uncharacterized membrane protein